MRVETLHVTLTNAQRRELEAALETTHDVRVYKRLKVVDLSSRGYTVRALAELFNACQQSIRHYLHSYQQGGLEARPSAGAGPSR
jgi:transposase